MPALLDLAEFREGIGVRVEGLLRPRAARNDLAQPGTAIRIGIWNIVVEPLAQLERCLQLRFRLGDRLRERLGRLPAKLRFGEAKLLFAAADIVVDSHEEGACLRLEFVERERLFALRRFPLLLVAARDRDARGDAADNDDSPNDSDRNARAVRAGVEHCLLDAGERGGNDALPVTALECRPDKVARELVVLGIADELLCGVEVEEPILNRDAQQYTVVAEEVLLRGRRAPLLRVGRRAERVDVDHEELDAVLRSELLHLLFELANVGAEHAVARSVEHVLAGEGRRCRSNRGCRGEPRKRGQGGNPENRSDPLHSRSPICKAARVAARRR